MLGILNMTSMFVKQKLFLMPAALGLMGVLLASACGPKKDKPEYVMRELKDESAPRFVVQPKIESFTQERVTISFGIDELGEAVVNLVPEKQSAALTSSDLFAMNLTNNPYALRSRLTSQQKKFVTFSNLQAGTSYQVFLAAQDELANRQAEVVTLEFTTPTGPAEIIFKNSPEPAFQDLPWSFKPELSQRRALVTLKKAPAWLKWDQRNFVLSGIPDEEAAARGSFSFVLSIGDKFFNGEQLYRVPVNGDPLLTYAWHIKNVGQSAFSQGTGLRGIDINLAPVAAMGLTGEGIKVRLYGSGMQIDHPDLVANIDFEDDNALANYRTEAPLGMSPGDSNDPSPLLIDGSLGDIGTAQAGIIGAVGWNNIGSRGIAPKVRLGAHNVLASGLPLEGDNTFGEVLVSAAVQPTTAPLNLLSFGSELATLIERVPAIKGEFASALQVAVTDKNAIFVKTAGEGDRKRYDANMDPYNNNPFMIVVGSVNAMGVKSSDAMAGSSLWITAPGGEAGFQVSMMEEANAEKFKKLEETHKWKVRLEDFTPGLVTTDNTSCERGFAKTVPYFQSPDPLVEPPALVFAGDVSTGFNVGWQSALNPNCDYTATLQKPTAGAAAVVTGVVALMLEHWERERRPDTPDLTLRDIKHILALTGRKIDSDIKPEMILIKGRPIERIPAWRKNAAGYEFHNYYGFGLIDAAAAIQMTDPNSYIPLPPAASATRVTGGVESGEIPEYSAQGLIESSEELKEGASENLVVETIQLHINISHHSLSNINITLESPSGTKSVFLPGQNGGIWPLNSEDIILISNAFYGEPAQGEWQLHIADLKAPIFEKNEEDGTWKKISGPGRLDAWHLIVNGYNVE